MKKILLTAIASIAIAAVAHANTYTDNNFDNTFLDAKNPSFTGQFTLAGYNPAAETITSAVATFNFGGLALDSFSITMSSDDLTHGSFSGFVTVTGDISDSSNINAWGILDSTGVLSYTVALTANSRLESVWLINSNLTAQSDSRGVSSVPDAGATSLLLGLGVIGILGAKRRFASVA